MFCGYWKDIVGALVVKPGYDWIGFFGTDEMMRFLTQQVAAIEQNLQVLVTDDLPFRSFNLPEWDKHYSQD